MRFATVLLGVCACGSRPSAPRAHEGYFCFERIVNAPQTDHPCATSEADCEEMASHMALHGCVAASHAWCYSWQDRPDAYLSPCGDSGRDCPDEAILGAGRECYGAPDECAAARTDDNTGGREATSCARPD
jgi:hypothetical protein